MNNSCSQTERQEPKINTNADRAAFGHRPCVFVFVFAALSLHSVCLMCVCTCFKDSILSTVVLHKTDVAYHYLHHDHAFLAPNKSFFFPPLLLDCRKMLSLFSFVLLTSREITICLIVGDTHTPQELGCTQIICYTSLPSFFLPLYFSAALSVFSSSFPSFSTPPSSLVIEVAIHQIATSVRCQHPLINDSYERILNE